MRRTSFALRATSSADASSASKCIHRRRGVRASTLVWALGVATLLATSAGPSGIAFAQEPAGILAPGNAVVTGFSGTRPPAAPVQGADPADLTEIDLSGPSARVVDLQAPGAPPQAQVLPAPKPFTVTASQVGQVFGVALDDATPPNIYVAATSAYGLPIIAPAPGGLARAKQGAANAAFMPGLFGPAQLGGGPGSIWRIDGVSGDVRLFANVTLDGAPNSGAALGGLAFDPASHTLFVVDRGTGMIHGFDLGGAERSRFDHGVAGRTAANMPPVPFDAAGRVDIANPAFKTDGPATWGYAPDERRIFGLGVRTGRLYYAPADEQVWSISIMPDGSFGGDPRSELQAPPWDGDNEISKITFDDQGTMLLAERAIPTGAYDFAALAKEGVGRVLRYRLVRTAEGAPPVWQPVPDEYAIGFPAEMRNGNGGVAVGYSYTQNGTLERSTCGGFIWSSGERLRATADPALAAQLAAGGPTVVNGLQGNAIDLVRPANVPPLSTYFVDYDDKFDDADARGHLGDLAIRRVCGQAMIPFIPPLIVAVPVGVCRPGDFRLPGGECCERRLVRRGRCEPPPQVCPRGEIRLPNGQCCDRRDVRDGRCQPPACPRGEIKLPNGQCCDPHDMREGRCQPPACPRGEIKLPNGQCCDRQNVKDGRCVPPPACPRGQIQLPGGQCCDPQFVRNGQCVPPVPRIERIPPQRLIVPVHPPRLGPPNRRIRVVGPKWRHPNLINRTPRFQQRQMFGPQRGGRGFHR